MASKIPNKPGTKAILTKAKPPMVKKTAPAAMPKAAVYKPAKAPARLKRGK